MLNISVPQLLQMAMNFRRANRLDDAERTYRDILRQDPNQLDALDWVSTRCYDTMRNEEAATLLRRAIALNPNVPWFHNNLGNALRDCGHMEEAVRCHEKAIVMLPNSAEAHNNLGLSLMDSHRFDEALPCWRKALSLNPNLTDAHWNMSLVLLAKGQMAEGWEHYEWRKKMPNVGREFSKPQWNGAALAGKTILLHCEQGLGDTIHFVRYAKLVAARGGRVILECQKELVELLRDVEGVERIVARGEPLPEFDVYASLLTLPKILGTTLENIPATASYLHAREDLLAKWRPRLAEIPGFKIGIAWQGNLQNPTGQRRSIPLEFFEPIAKLPGVQLLSLQKGAGGEAIKTLADRFTVIDLARELDETTGPFLDTAAVMKCVDLVITADTSTCHLAGALGAPVWTVMPKLCDWRWLLDRSDTPWYPSMRLFRQEQDGQWGPVFARMAQELQARGTR